jgi:hypothetical protein
MELVSPLTTTPTLVLTSLFKGNTYARFVGCLDKIYVITEYNFYLLSIFISYCETNSLLWNERIYSRVR